MLDGMTEKTTVTIGEVSMSLARRRAAKEGLDVGRWIDRAIRNEAAQGDVDVIEDWQARLPPADQVTLGALERLDHVPDSC